MAGALARTERLDHEPDDVVIPRKSSREPGTDLQIPQTGIR